MGSFNDNTCFLFADPGFMTGAATAIDMGGTLIIYNQSGSPQEADLRALASDWAAIGKDIHDSVEKLEKERERQ